MARSFTANVGKFNAKAQWGTTGQARAGEIKSPDETQAGALSATGTGRRKMLNGVRRTGSRRLAFGDS
jgi:hypothetical protein